MPDQKTPVVLPGEQWLTRSGEVADTFGIPDDSAADSAAIRVSVRGYTWYVLSDGRYLGLLGADHEHDLVWRIASAPVAQQTDTGAAAEVYTAQVSALDLLDAAAKHMRDRADTYDKSTGERSMEQTVDIFNRFHGTALSETQGWHFMQILKDVRLFSNTSAPHRDSIDDGVAYAALKGESLLKGAK